MKNLHTFLGEAAVLSRQIAAVRIFAVGKEIAYLSARWFYICSKTWPGGGRAPIFACQKVLLSRRPDRRRLRHVGRCGNDYSRVREKQTMNADGICTGSSLLAD
jgi:hypothetical protein